MKARIIFMWTRDDALLIYKALLRPAAEQCGFSVALYGSVLLDGEGNDLDVFMVPQRENPDMASLLDTLRRHLRDVTDPIAGDWNRYVIIATTQDGKKIDMQVTPL
jgi:hypothetical protein